MLHESISRSRELRKNLTESEQRLRYFLRKKRFLGLRFNRQVPIGDYIVDFLCKNKKLIIEIDGEQHTSQEATTYDLNRTIFLNQKGYTVLRYWNFEVFEDIEVVLEDILSFVDKDLIL